MNHAGEIATLTRQARPHVALITLIAPAHLGYFDSVEAIADAKAEIFDGLEPGGTAVLNRDDEQYARLHVRAERRAGRIVTFGAHAEADWRLVEAACDPDGSDVVAERRGTRHAYRLGIPGRHWVQNSLGILAVVEALGADVGGSVAGAGRSRAARRAAGASAASRVPGGDALLLDESYNANPASMQAALELLGQMPGRRVAVLGDMLELGERGPSCMRGWRSRWRAPVSPAFSLAVR